MMMNARLFGVLFASVTIAAFSSTLACAQNFEGRAAITQIDDHLWELTEDLFYHDASKWIWKAPKGYRTDGASIPWPLWSFVGSPFTGRYVKAAIIHDVYCDLKSRD